MMDRRRALMGAKKPRIPAEYQEVEYIGCTDTQYLSMTLATPIDPGATGFSVEYYIASRASKYAPKLLRVINKNGSSVDLFGPITASQASSGNTINVLVNLNGYSNYSVSSSIYSSLNTWHKCEANYLQSEIITHNDAKTNDARGATKKASISIVELMRDTSDNTITFNGRLKSLRISSDNAEVLSFVPCYRKSDSVIGMFEVHTQTFLTNAGTGSFTKGADVT